MSPTALVTAWCAYQANLWDSNEGVELALALESQTLHSKAVLSGDQHRMMDGITALEVAKAVGTGNSSLAHFYASRVREELGSAISAWLELDPLSNKSAPAHPLLMPEYIEKVTKKSLDIQEEFERESKKHMREAQVAGGISDSYVLLTVLFSVVFFFRNNVDLSGTSCSDNAGQYSHVRHGAFTD